MLKLYRKLESGINPEFELLRYLTEKAGFERSPQLAGAIEYVPFRGESHALAVLQAAVEHQGSGWEWMLDELSRFYEFCAAGAQSETQDSGIFTVFQDALGFAPEAVATLGRRTAELHLALAASKDDPAFMPEPLTDSDIAFLIDFLRGDVERVFKLLRDNVSRLPEELIPEAEEVLQHEKHFKTWFEQVKPLDGVVSKIRVHGDYHLGQVLRVKNDYVIIDFEGEPGRSLSERRAKTSALKDVAGMLRSLSYVAHSALLNYTNRRPDQLSRLLGYAKLWESAMSSLFLRTYCDRAHGAAFLPQDNGHLKELLDLYVWERMLYELRYEIDNRPAWIRIPLQSIAGMIER